MIWLKRSQLVKERLTCGAIGTRKARKTFALSVFAFTFPVAIRRAHFAAGRVLVKFGFELEFQRCLIVVENGKVPQALVQKHKEPSVHHFLYGLLAISLVQSFIDAGQVALYALTVKAFEYSELGKCGRGVFVRIDADLRVLAKRQVELDVHGLVQIELNVEEFVRSDLVVDGVADAREQNRTWH